MTINFDNIQKLSLSAMFLMIGIAFFTIPLYELTQGTVTVQNLDGYNIDREDAMQQGLRDEFAANALKLYQMQLATANDTEMIRAMLAQLSPVHSSQ